MPGIQTQLGQDKAKDKCVNLDLSIDPLTGECLASKTETAILANINEDSDVLDETNNNKNDKDNDIKTTCVGNLLSVSSNGNTIGKVIIRKLSSDEDLGNSSSRRSSRSSRRRSSHLADIQEQFIPDEKILEVRIDPLTGEVQTVEVCRSKCTPTQNSPNSSSCQEKTIPVRSTQIKESESLNKPLDFDQEKRRKLSVEITKVMSSIKTSGEQQDDGIGSLPNTPTDIFLDRPPRLSVPQVDDGLSFSSSEESFDRFGQLQREQRETSTGTSCSGGMNQYQTTSLDGEYGTDSVCSWDESSSLAQDDDGDDLQSRPSSAQPTVSTSTLTVAITGSGNLSSTSTSSSTSALCGNNNNTNQANRTCTGAFSRAMERFTNANQSIPPCITAPSSSNSDNVVNNSMENKESDSDKNGSSETYNNSVMRRQSSPMVRPSSS